MKQIFYLGIITSLMLLVSCKKDKDLQPLPPPISNTPELITSIKLLFVDSANTNNTASAYFNDPDGPGGNSPIQFDTIRLKLNKTYFVTLLVFDQTKNPVDTVSKEIWKERDEHQFFFKHTGVNISTIYTDIDTKNIPVGLGTKWRTGAISNGTSRIVLKHQTDGTKNGTEGPGETDIEVNFQSHITN
jgi:hypothetical protein